MAVDWHEVSLGEVCSIQGGYAFKSKDFSGSGVPVAKIKNVRKGFVDIQEADYVSHTIAASAKDYYVRHGDVLISMTGSGPNAPASIVGRVALHSGADEAFLINQRVGRFRPVDSDKINLRYLYFLFSQAVMQDHLVSIATGSANQVNISARQIMGIKVKLPPIYEQVAISHILGTLDDKIELNRQINTTLESMAQALFKSWFVDFDPVIDNALAAGNDIPDALQAKAAKRKALGANRKPLPDGLQQQFPDRFVFTEAMGWVPDGWKSGVVSDLCLKIQNGGTPKKDIAEYWINGTIPWLTSGEVRQTIADGAQQCIADAGLANSSAKWLPEGATVVAMYGATAGQVAYVSSPLTTNQAVCGLIPKEGYRYFVYLALERLVKELANQARGSAQQNISKGIIENTKCLCPPKEMAEQFSVIIDQLFSRWIANLRANSSLSGLRDTLLPKLLSGELRIPEAEKQLAEAL